MPDQPVYLDQQSREVNQPNGEQKLYKGMQDAFKTPGEDKKKKEGFDYKAFLKNMASGMTSQPQQNTQHSQQAPQMPAYMQQRPPVMYGNQGQYMNTGAQMQPPPQQQSPDMDPYAAMKMRQAFQGK